MLYFPIHNRNHKTLRINHPYPPHRKDFILFSRLKPIAFLRDSDIKPKNCATALLGSAILAFGLYQIHSFSGVTEGGVLGMTLLLHHWFNISPALSGLIMNLACYLLGLKLLGREFILYSLVAGGGFSLFYMIFEQFPPL